MRRSDLQVAIKCNEEREKTVWDTLFKALALVLVIEGIMPFISPDKWRQTMLQAGQLPNNILRVIGLVSMLSGVILLYLSS